MIALGKTVTDIAGELALSVKTVSTYRSRIIEKTRNEEQRRIDPLCHPEPVGGIDDGKKILHGVVGQTPTLPEGYVLQQVQSLAACVAK